MQSTVGNSTLSRPRANNLATFSFKAKPSTVPLSTRINGSVDGKNLFKYKVHVLATATYDTIPLYRQWLTRQVRKEGFYIFRQ